MINNKFIIPILALLLIAMCSFKSTDHNNKLNMQELQIVEHVEKELTIDGSKNWDEVRIARTKFFVKAFTDVLTKYKQRIPDEPIESLYTVVDERVENLINKYEL